MSKFKKILCFSALFCLTACSRGYLSVQQEWVDSRYLASTYVATPDPRQANPPIGQKLIIRWWVPAAIFEKNPVLVLQVIRWDFTEETIRFPLKKRFGYEIYSLLNQNYEETEGLLTYRAQIVTDDQEVVTEWKHQLWVNLIKIDGKTMAPEPNPDLNPEVIPDDNYQLDDFDEELYALDPAYEDNDIGKIEKGLLQTDEESNASADKISSSVETQSKQGSVIDTPYLSDCSSSDKD